MPELKRTYRSNGKTGVMGIKIFSTFAVRQMFRFHEAVSRFSCS